MKKVIDFIKKNKVYVLGILFVFFFFRSCQKSVSVDNLEKSNVELQEKVDRY